MTTTYSVEQETWVTSILTKDCAFEVLGLNKNAKQDDASVIKAFKKLALLVHPDKNPHPQSVDAFKKVAQSSEHLKTEEKRNNYIKNGGAKKNFYNQENEDEDDYDDEFGMVRQKLNL